MQLKDMLSDVWNVEPLLVTTATTGLDPHKDKLLAVALKDPTTDFPPTVLFQETHGEELMKAQRYHLISDELMYSKGLDEDSFMEALEGAIRGKTLLTYNTDFQHAFLSIALEDPALRVYDLSVIEQGLRKGIQLDEEEAALFSKAYGSIRSFYYPLPVATICHHLKMTRQPSPGQLPLERSLDVLQKLYNEASCLEVQLLPS